MMAKLKKYSYKDWWNGDVLLEESTLYDIKDAQLKIVAWNDFNDSDVERIKAKQSELFKSSTNKLLDELKAQFELRYKASEMKQLYLKDEIKECLNIMKGLIPNLPIVHFEIWGVSFDNQYVSDIQHHIKRTIKSGIIDGFGFVHSPHCKFQNHSQLDPRVYGSSIWEYYKWLCSIKFKFIKNERTVLKEVNGNSLEVYTNNFPNIFKNGNAYHLFIDLKNCTVKQSTVVADFAFIFHKMKNGGLINIDIKHKTFIAMLNNEYDARILVTKFPFRNPRAKEVQYKALLVRYGFGEIHNS